MQTTKNEEPNFIEKEFFRTVLGFMGNVYCEGTFKSGRIIKIAEINENYLECDCIDEVL